MNIDLREARIAAEQLRDRMMLLKRVIMGEITQRPAEEVIRVPTPGSCSPSARGSTRPGGGTTAPAPSYGFHNPAPSSAPRLPPNAVAPEAARQALAGIVAELRGTAAALQAAAAHLIEAANALESGRRAASTGAPSSSASSSHPAVPPRSTHGGRRAPRYRNEHCICGHLAAMHPGDENCERCDCFKLRPL